MTIAHCDWGWIAITSSIRDGLFCSSLSADKRIWSFIWTQIWMQIKHLLFGSIEHILGHCMSPMGENAGAFLKLIKDKSWKTKELNWTYTTLSYANEI